MNKSEYNNRIRLLIDVGLLCLLAVATGHGQTAHAKNYGENSTQTAENFGYGSKVVPIKNNTQPKTQQFAQDYAQNYNAASAEDFGYGSRVTSIKKPTWFNLRIDGGMLFPSNAIIVRGGSADTLMTDTIGWDVGGSFGASFNRGTIAQIDVSGVVNYGRWGATIVAGDKDEEIVEGNSQLIESTMVLAEANWRPLQSDKGLIAPFLGMGLGMDIISWLNKDISQTKDYKKSAIGITGLFQIGLGFDWFFATNWAVGVKYNYLIPFGKNIEVGNQSSGGNAQPVLYTPGNVHLLNAVLTISF
ncbi:MAG: hypothetical protein QM529_07710 [Hydrotalea sp.]|nr:hypothetical protein [Hydrotalea sp.]